MKGSIVIVEDDKRLSALICQYLESELYTVHPFYSGLNASEEIQKLNPDLVILDYMLPDVDGIHVCRELLRKGFSSPVIMLTAHDDDFTEVTALNSGVDDYITKPLRPDVLMARINALLRRRNSQKDKRGRDLIEVQDLNIDIVDRIIFRDDNKIDTTDAEFDLLVELVKRAGKIVKRNELFTALRGFDYNGTDRSVDQRVCTLRKKLGDDDAPHRYIRTIRNKGYLFPVNGW
ncbi:MAG: DNA-binding response OmpR family regulator [Alteromonadaceae bacterium]|jgi:DNA-binding response OmpR family regulator